MPARPNAVHERIVTVANPSSMDRVLLAGPLSFPFSTITTTLLAKARSTVTIPVLFGSTDGLLHLDELVIDGGEDCEFTVPVRALGSGLIRASPESLEFTLGAGEVATKAVLIENTRRTATDVRLEWFTVGGSPPPLSAGTSWVTLPDGGSISIPITAAPLAWERVSAQLRLTSPGQSSSVAVLITPLVAAPRGHAARHRHPACRRRP